ncbi:selenocysteine lyase [Ixodes scapularis]|uniref:selenocysteine lyase n=1 Tax=Ixodes scapularis TaxID=6945 RepID=UPI001A9D85FD|nr:selenocysteine lyase [Ixodes scapularis]
METENNHGKVVYLDYNATTPTAVEVQVSICDALKNAWGNPTSSHAAGDAARKLTDKARSDVATIIGGKPQEIVFTSGGTESNNMIVHSSVRHFKEVKHNYAALAHYDIPHCITTNVEHKSVLLPLKYLKENGNTDLTIVPVSKSSGSVIAEDIISAIRPHTIFISVMLAQNETGILQPVGDIGALLEEVNRERKKESLPEILFHTDAAQAIGKVKIDVDALKVDYLSIAGHKFYGPRSGALYFRETKPLYPFILGAGQERGYRSGTPNVCMIAGLGTAASLVIKGLDGFQRSMRESRDYLEKKLQDAFGSKVSFNHRKGAAALPNTCSVSFKGMNGPNILCKAKFVQASTGAACHHTAEPSEVLLNSGVPADSARGTLRLSVGRNTSHADIDLAVRHLQDAVALLQKPGN